jgi:molybdopterin-biosynthesis enzyme MoeA-like protein
MVSGISAMCEDWILNLNLSRCKDAVQECEMDMGDWVVVGGGSGADWDDADVLATAASRHSSRGLETLTFDI